MNGVKFSSVALTLSALTLLNGSVFAEEQPSECVGDIECIVVTGRLKEESLLTAPIAANYIDYQTISDTNIENVADFIQLTSNMTIAESQSIGTSFISIRGISQVRNSESPVAVIVDDVLQVNGRQFRQDLLDVESVEIIKGPQGALYGRNATGGVVILRTKAPTEELSGTFKAGIGDNNRYQLQGSISDTLNNESSYRVSFHTRENDGDLYNKTLNQPSNSFKENVIRGQYLYQPTTKSQLWLTAKASEFEGGALNFVYQPALYAPDAITLADGGFPFDFSASDSNDVVDYLTANNPGFNERKLFEASVKLEHEFEQLNLLAVTGYVSMDEYAHGDQFPYTAAPSRSTIIGSIDGGQTQYVDLSSLSQELRIWGEANEFNWMMGLYYLQTDRFISTSTSTDLGQGLSTIKHSPKYQDPINPTQSFFADDNDNSAWAFYVNSDFQIFKPLELSLALRYDEDQRKQVVSAFNMADPGSINEVSFSQWQPKVTLNYKFSNYANAFATWGVGFRSGQFNQSGTAAAAKSAGVMGVKDIADKEVSASFELGYKNYLKDLGLRISANLFSTEVEDQHYFVFIGAVGAQVITNIDEVSLVGGEVSLQKSLSDNWNISLSYGHTESEINAYQLAPELVGNKTPYVPNKTFNVVLEYVKTLGNDLELFARTDHEIRGKQFWTPENSTPREQLQLTNLHFGVESLIDDWRVVVGINNAFNEKYNAEFVAGGFAHPASGRTWQIDLSYQF